MIWSKNYLRFSVYFVRFLVLFILIWMDKIYVQRMLPCRLDPMRHSGMFFGL